MIIIIIVLWLLLLLFFDCFGFNIIFANVFIIIMYPTIIIFTLLHH
jgi:hypothetical protein